MSANLYVCKQKKCGQETKIKVPFEILPPLNLPCDNPYGHFEFAQIFHVLSVSKGDGWKV